MKEGPIKNFDNLATTENRRVALTIMESGLDAINTEKVINSSVILTGNVLEINGNKFFLDNYKNIKVVGFGKASPIAALALEKILGPRIKEGAVIGLSRADCKYIETFSGTHPRPSEANLEAGEKIYNIIKNSGVEDLIIVLVSGGGSALLCYGNNECEQGIKLYDSFLKTGKTIAEMNTVRKHLSLLKGGGLAEIAFPATVVGLIFSDVPGDNFENVASGPTYKDMTTLADAEKIIEEYGLGGYNLVETPKEDKYFEKVYNFVLVSNKIAVEAMSKKAGSFNLEVNIASTELYDEMGRTLEKIFSLKKASPIGLRPRENSVVLAAGEPSIIVTDKNGKGGRNLHIGLLALKNKMIGRDTVFISFASDGMDNSDVAGAVVDQKTLENVENLGLNIDDYLNRFDSYSFFQKTGDTIITGPTGANVSDLFILLDRKQ